MSRELPWFRIGVAGFLVAAVVGVILVVRGGHSIPDEVQPIEWNRQACSHCQMLIGDPHHAAQLITEEGEVMSFDDPGCALRYLEDHHPAVHRLWFHAGIGDRWLPSDRVSFTTNGTTPMGSGLIAVEPGTPHAIDLEAARRTAAQAHASEDMR